MKNVHRFFATKYMKYKLVIFDLDGTILDTLDDLTDSLNYILKKNDFPIHTKEEVRFFVGNGIPKLIERALPKDSSQKIQSEIYEQFCNYYESHSQIKTQPYDKIPELLKTLKDLKIKIAVNSNKAENIAKQICDSYFPKLIDLVAGGRKGIPHKPNPAGVNRILSELKIEKCETIYVGDSDVDFMTAVNSGVDVISVDWGFRGEKFLLEHGAKIVVKTPSELLEKIIKN